MKRKFKFWILLFFGICLFAPFLYLSIMIQVWSGGFSLNGVLLSFPFMISLIFYCYFLYCYLKGRKKVRYPYVPPEGRMDIYFPRTNIPRPIHEDVRRYPRYFKLEKKKRYERRERPEKNSKH